MNDKTVPSDANSVESEIIYLLISFKQNLSVDDSFIELDLILYLIESIMSLFIIKPALSEFLFYSKSNLTTSKQFNELQYLIIILT